jgi:hypothetical protein
LIKGYFDESISCGGSVFTVAGFLAEEAEWDSLVSEWEERLKKDGLTYFHATDCAGGWNDFSALSQEQRIALDTDLIASITSKRLAGFAISVAHKDFDELVKGSEAAKAVLTESPYFIAMQLVVRWVCDEIKRSFPNEAAVDFMFEENNVVSGQAKQIYEELKRKNPELSAFMGSLTYGSKKENIPLQVADELAFEAAKNVGNWIDGTRYRMPIQLMIEAKILSLSYLDRKGMEDFIVRQTPLLKTS